MSRIRYSVGWTTFSGRYLEEVEWCESGECDIQALKARAVAKGWTPPAWWKPWRWNDHAYPDVPPIEEALCRREGKTDDRPQGRS